ncbi:MAG: CoA pyrophosphatase [Acidimicrobiales bacterium]|nr:CoA pyrophosphatase [Acidimicrobiales bacterium]MCB9392430.1 CoA pyrophosphatase [Acidimicrobiaceae bacterium]
MNADGAPRRRGGDQFIPRPDQWRLGGAAPWASGRRPHGIRLDELLDVVRARVPGRLAPPFPDARNSAVLIVLHDTPQGPEVLFTKRASHLRNHRGEISFPGGRMDPDETPIDTALREAWEEVALDPGLVTVHGELDHLSTIVSRSYIVPVVATVDVRPELTPHDAEVARILWVPLDVLADADTYREEWWGTPDLERPIHFFELEDETVWGATARMLHQLLRLAHAVDGPEPPAW